MIKLFKVDYLRNPKDKNSKPTTEYYTSDDMAKVMNKVVQPLLDDRNVDVINISLTVPIQAHIE